jgi:hypothetical protein
MSEKVLRKLIDSLFLFTNEELRTLKAILRQKKALDALTGQIETILILRESDGPTRHSRVRESTSRRPIKEVEDDTAAVEGKDLTNLSPGDLKDAFFKVLQNRELYPTTADVVEALNTHFGCDFQYRAFKKRGRKDLISKCWSFLDSLPDQDRGESLRKFFQEHQIKYSGSTGYQDLFRVLTDNE